MAGIIKSSGARDEAKQGQTAAFNFHDMSVKAQAYLDQVRQQADEILRQAQEQAKQIRQQAEAQGKQAAIKEAEQVVDKRLSAKFEQRWQTVQPVVTEIGRGLEHARQGWVLKWEENLVNLAAAIAERLVRRELSLSPKITLDWLREALELASGAEHVEVLLHPDDLDQLGDRVPKLAAALGKFAALKITADPAISRGGCRVRTDFGDIDQQLESQMLRVKQELR